MHNILNILKLFDEGKERALTEYDEIVKAAEEEVAKRKIENEKRLNEVEAAYQKNLSTLVDKAFYNVFLRLGEEDE